MRNQHTRNERSGKRKAANKEKKGRLELAEGAREEKAGEKESQQDDRRCCEGPPRRGGWRSGRTDTLKEEGQVRVCGTIEMGRVRVNRRLLQQWLARRVVRGEGGANARGASGDENKEREGVVATADSCARAMLLRSKLVVVAARVPSREEGGEVFFLLRIRRRRREIE